MNESKPWWQSRTVIGALVVIVSSAAGLYGIQIDVGALTEIILQILALSGGVVAIYGRVKAERPIRRKSAADELQRVELPPTRPGTDHAPKGGLPGFEDLDRIL